MQVRERACAVQRQDAEQGTCLHVPVARMQKQRLALRRACRSWRELAGRDELWQPLYHACFPQAAGRRHRRQQGQQEQLLGDAAADAAGAEPQAAAAGAAPAAAATAATSAGGSCGGGSEEGACAAFRCEAQRKWQLAQELACAVLLLMPACSPSTLQATRQCCCRGAAAACGAGASWSGRRPPMRRPAMAQAPQMRP